MSQIVDGENAQLGVQFPSHGNILPTMPRMTEDSYHRPIPEIFSILTLSPDKRSALILEILQRELKLGEDSRK